MLCTASYLCYPSAVLALPTADQKKLAVTSEMSSGKVPFAKNGTSTNTWGFWIAESYRQISKLAIIEQ